MSECEEAWTGSLRDMDDDFMLYKFKVLPCTRKGAHSWTECCYTHPGEKAARRCTKTHTYSAEACPDARKSGKCARGDLCPYSHGVFEQWLHPSRYRTQLCSFGTACRRPVCFFAHTVQELRVPTAAGPPAGAGFPGSANAAAAAAAAAAAFRVNPASMTGLAGNDNGYLALMQQALLSQMSHVDGATATLINRYQAASCAALANAAACQRQQQQHQAAAAAAAAAAIAAAAHNPASLLSMAQAAHAYQAAAAAAAAAAANVPLPHQPMGSGNQPLAHLSSVSTRSSSSNVSSPTCSNTNSFPSSVSTFNDGCNGDMRCGPDGMSGCASPGGPSLYDSYFLQQALLGTGGGQAGNNGWTSEPPVHKAAAALPPASSAFSMPWLPAGSGPGPLIHDAAPMGGYPSGLMPATPGISDGCHAGAPGASSGLDALAKQLSLQLSMQFY